MWIGIFVEKYIKGVHPYTGKEMPFLAILAYLQHCLGIRTYFFDVHWLLHADMHWRRAQAATCPDQLASGKAVQCPNPFFFVKRAHMDHLNEKWHFFFVIICTACYNTNLKYPSYKRTNITCRSDCNGYTTQHHLQFHPKPESKEAENHGVFP